jgi:hypothetical protein
MYEISVPIFAQFLTKPIDRARQKRAHCEARKIEPSALLSARLFPNGATRDFISQSMLLNNALPNFYFHCTTAYDILRQCGVELGKRNFMGTPVSP